MTHPRFAQRHARAAHERLVLSRTDDGCLVYAATDPQHVYLVAGPPETPTCTCPDFRAHQTDPGWRCPHILAVLNHNRKAEPSATTEAAAERAAIQVEGRPRKRGNGPAGNGQTQMILKRSVSPDGRIDALSVEFACPIDGLPPEAIKLRAAQTLELQTSIVRDFLGARPPANASNSRNGNNQKTEAEPEASSLVPARLVSVGGLDGKWGRRLFLNVQVNGRTAKLFGTPKQLQAALATAGFPNVAIAEGAQLNLPCQVIAAPSPDGRYLNIVQVFPELHAQAGRRS